MDEGGGGFKPRTPPVLARSHRCFLAAPQASVRRAPQVLWLPLGLEGDDDTTGHVDNMACFAAPGTVLLHWAELAEDPLQHARSQAALEYLAGQTDARGRPLKARRRTRTRSHTAWCSPLSSPEHF